MYTVTNDFGDMLIHTSNYALADFVSQNAKGVERGLFLVVGGDDARLVESKGIFRRVYSK